MTGTFVKFDTPGHGELATGAEVVVTKLFHALGYHVPANHIAYIRRDDLMIAEGARMDYDDGRQRPLTGEDVDLVLAGAAQEPNGSYRVVASRALEGTPVGGFRFHGTRSDDPNDIVPHESRRELRALRVFSAWVNHVDCKGSNTLDTIVAGPSGRVVRHHLLDFGSTLGSGGVMAREPWEGAEFIYDGRQTLDRLGTFGVDDERLDARSLPGPRGGGTVRGRGVHPRDVEATTPESCLPADRAGRSVLGRPTRGGLHGPRRSAPRWRVRATPIPGPSRI